VVRLRDALVTSARFKSDPRLRESSLSGVSALSSAATTLLPLSPLRARLRRS